MEDLIKRKDAMDAINCNIVITGKRNAEEVASTIGTFVDRIKALPSAETKRVKGRWIEIPSYMNHTYKCSECGRLLVNVTDGKNNVSKHYPYCHCGADMRGGSDETIAD